MSGERSVTAGTAVSEWAPSHNIGELIAFLASGKVKHLSSAAIDVNGASYVR